MVEDTIVELVLDLSERHDVHAVGIGAAGWVDADRSRVLFAPHLSWRDEPLRDRLSERLLVPVMVDNDANTAAWAEWRFGAGRGETDLVMITLGTGIGGAILEDGQVKRGRYGVAGEFGHMQVVPGGHRCPCGNRGCWEQYSSGNALVREARELAAADSPVAYGLIDRVGGNIARHHRTADHRTGPRAATRCASSCSRTSASGSASASPTWPPPSTRPAS